MDPLEQRIEVEATPAGVRDDDLTVDDATLRQRRAQRIEQLGKVAAERSQFAALQLDPVSIAEDETTEPVPLRLEQPAIAVGDRSGEFRQHGLNRWLQRQIESSGGIVPGRSGGGIARAGHRSSVLPTARGEPWRSRASG